MLGRLTLSLLITTNVVACTDLMSEDEENLSSEEQACNHHDELAPLKKFHDRYKDVNAAIADGYELGVIYNDNRVVAGCVMHPTNPALFGAMGYHYFRQDRFDDGKIKELKPEVLVYHTGASGLELGAVEWVVPKPVWEAKHGVGAEPPEVYGHMLMVLNPTLNWYVGHAWLWTENPSGVFYDWNPAVTCP